MVYGSRPTGKLNVFLLVWVKYNMNFCKNHEIYSEIKVPPDAMEFIIYIYETKLQRGGF